MQEVCINESFFQGAVSVQRGDGTFQPWRLPCDRLDLFPAPDEVLVDRAGHSSGVRLRVRTDATTVELRCEPLGSPYGDGSRVLDATVDNAIVASAEAKDDSERITFADLPAGDKVVDLWLPHEAPCLATGLAVNDGAACRAAADDRKRWVTYGSSLTHCARAHSSSRTWPAIVARRMDWHLTSLGYGGNCCLEPMVAVMIRDLPADLITFKLGINCIGGALSPRTFKAAVVGLVKIIREKHAATPIALISPMAYPPNETEPNVLDHTIAGMREDVADAHRRLVADGDENLQYFDGLELFNVAEIAQYTEDECHPNGDGIELMAEHFLDRFVPNLPL